MLTYFFFCCHIYSEHLYCFVLHCSPHPYLFFNEDGDSFTFMGFIINQETGDILDPRTNEILTPQALPQLLQQALIQNRVNLSENFDQLPRHVDYTLLYYSVQTQYHAHTVV